MVLLLHITIMHLKGRKDHISKLGTDFTLDFILQLINGNNLKLLHIRGTEGNILINN